MTYILTKIVIEFIKKYFTKLLLSQFIVHLAIGMRRKI